MRDLNDLINVVFTPMLVVMTCGIDLVLLVMFRDLVEYLEKCRRTKLEVALI